ncbi:MAG: hypothetical protein H0U95_10345 [Bacteroidetes bacterium]|nr:hypothetical protein [Bacteroidota bacterium]
MRTIFLLLFIFGFLNFLTTQNLTLKINNKTGYDVHEILLPNNEIRLFEIDRLLVISNLKYIVVRNDLSYSPLFFGKGTIYNKQKGSLEDFPMYTDPSNFDTLRNCEIEYDLLISEYDHGNGYKLFYKFVNIVRKPEKGIITNKFAGEYYPVNEEGDKLSAICKEGILRINKNNTFNYSLTPDKIWCPDMKEYTYEGSCIEKNDTLYLGAKDLKPLIEPRFSFTEKDSDRTILISLFNDNGELIDIEGAQSISSTKSTIDRNSFKIPFNKNYIKLNDKRIFGLTIFPVGYPPVQIFLKKIKGGAKINVTLYTNYYDAFFSGRKFIYSNNTLTEVTEGKQNSNYFKAE